MRFEVAPKNSMFKLWFFLLMLPLLGMGFSGASKAEAGEMILIPEGPFSMGSSDEDIFWAAKQFQEKYVKKRGLAT